jgi:hypothetical protein
MRNDISKFQWILTSHRIATPFSVSTLSRPCHAPVTCLSRPCHVPVTSLSRFSQYPVTSLSRPCHVPVTSLSRPYHVPITSLSRSYHVPVTCLSSLMILIIHSQNMPYISTVGGGSKNALAFFTTDMLYKNRH